MRKTIIFAALVAALAGTVSAQVNGAGTVTVNGIPPGQVNCRVAGCAWSAATAYNVNDVVIDSGSTYICTSAHTNHEPPNGSYWTAMGASIATPISLANGGLNTDISCCGVLGDLLYADTATTFARRTPNTTIVPMYLQQTGNGTSSAGPTWSSALTATAVTDSGLTAGRIPFSTTGGLLTDDAAITATGGTYPGINVFKDTGSGVLEVGKSQLSTDAVAIYPGNGGLIIGSTQAIVFSTGHTLSGTQDAGLKRSGAGVVKVTDGTTGYAAIDASGYKASGAAGMTTVVTVRNSGGAADCTETFTAGILTATTCSHT